jgi:hypothetical protein
VAAAVREGSDTEVAVTVTVAGEGTALGAVYRPVEEMTPHVAPEQPAPESDQVTPLFCASLETVGVNCCVAETATDAEIGATLTETGRVSVMVVEELFVLSASDVAINVTALGVG